jgi:hypothetical protein
MRRSTCHPLTNLIKGEWHRMQHPTCKIGDQLGLSDEQGHSAATLGLALLSNAVVAARIHDRGLRGVCESNETVTCPV